MLWLKRLSLILFLFTINCEIYSETPGNQNEFKRKIISLDGSWEIAQGQMDIIPDTFTGKVPVPGLIDMAEPAFKDVGLKSDLRQAFWYRRGFKIEQDVPDAAILKIGKAKY